MQCQNERSQSSNRETAMKMLRSKLAERQERERQEEIAREKGEAQDVNFGSQIRSYVLHPYTMVKDHRTNYEMGDAQRVLDGDLDGFVRAELLRRPAPDARASEPLVADRSEQPTAPYLDAVVGYAFRGPGALPRARPQGRRRRRPGLRFALGDRALALDVPQDIEGIDVGPSPTPYERAEALAAEAYGAARTWFLTNGATQGNHALCLALAPLGRAVVAQRNSHASLVDGLVLSGGVPSFVAPEYDDELGHGARRHARGAARAALARDAGRARRVHRLADLLRDGRRRRGLRRGRARRRRPARRRPGVGPALRLPPRSAAERADAGRRRRADLDAQDRRLAHAERDAARRRRRPHRHRRASARAMRLVRSTSPSSLLLASLDASRRQLAVHGEALLHETLAGGRRAARRSSPRCRASP